MELAHSLSKSFPKILTPTTCGQSALVKGLSTPINRGKPKREGFLLYCISEMDIHFVVDNPLSFLSLLRLSYRC